MNSIGHAAIYLYLYSRIRGIRQDKVQDTRGHFNVGESQEA
jgi:hypothetical protein